LSTSNILEPQDTDKKTNSFSEVLRNRPFLHLWVAQSLAQTAQNGIHFVQLVLIEELTHSSQHIGIMILAFSLPAVVFSSIAGLVVDRVSKKNTLVLVNSLRVLTALSYLLALHALNGVSLLLFIYLITFVASALGQFFSPAEVASIPILVESEQLLTANSLFNLTLTASQVVGLIILFPLVVKLGDFFWGPGMGIRISFSLVALMYVIATILVSRLPTDKPSRDRPDRDQIWTYARNELQEGWQFVRAHATIYVPLIHLSLLMTLVMVMAMLVPGFATRVLHVSTEDSVYIFTPAGLGMLIGTFLIGRYGDRFRREVLSNVGALSQAFTLVALGLVGWIGDGKLNVIPMVMLLSLFIGFEFALLGIPAQTVLQERTPEPLLGRVFAIQFLLTNLVGIPPLLFIGTLADWITIPPTIILVGGGTFLVGMWCVYYTYRVPAPTTLELAPSNSRLGEPASDETMTGLSLSDTVPVVPANPGPLLLEDDVLTYD